MLTFDQNLSIKNFLSSVDYIVIGTILMLHLLAMLYSRSNQATIAGKTLNAGKQLALPLFVPTLVVSWYGKFFYVSQTAFDNGLYNFYTQGVFWYIAYMLFAFYIVNKIRAYKAVNFSDLINKIYGDNSSAIATILIIIKALPLAYIVSLIMALQMFMNISVFSTVALVIAWLIFNVKVGSMRTNVYSNLIHFTCVIAAVVLLLIFAVQKWGGLSFLHANLPATYFQPRGVHGLASMLAWFVLAISTTFISPIFYQNCIAADSDRTAKVGIVICTAVWLLIDVCTTAGAMYAKAVFPHVEFLSAYGMFVSDLLPLGVRGLFVAGILGTIIPSISAYLSIIKSSLNYELISNYSKNKILIFSSLMMLVVALIFQDGLLTVKSYFAGCLLIPMLIGFFVPRLITQGSLLGSILLSCFAMRIWQMGIMHSTVEFDITMIGCAASIIVFVLNYSYIKVNGLLTN